MKDASRTEFSVPLSSDTRREAQAEAQAVAERVQELFVAHFAKGKAFAPEEVSISRHEFCGKLAASGFRATVTTMLRQGVGHPSSSGGFSVLVSAEAYVPAVARSHYKAESRVFSIQLVCGILIALAIAAVVAVGVYLTGWLVLHTWYLVAAIVGGGVLGRLIANLVGRAERAKAIQNASRDPVVARCASEWAAFRKGLQDYAQSSGGSTPA